MIADFATTVHHLLCCFLSLSLLLSLFHDDGLDFVVLFISLYRFTPVDLQFLHLWWEPHSQPRQSASVFWNSDVHCDIHALWWARDPPRPVSNSDGCYSGYSMYCSAILCRPQRHYLNRSSDLCYGVRCLFFERSRWSHRTSGSC